MDFAKFVQILETDTLFFSRLSSFQDPFEGHPPRTVVEAFRTIPTGLSEEEREKRTTVARNNLELFRNSRRLVCASCWHANEAESAAMWNLYLRSGEGIAIRTTFGNLVKSFSTTSPAISGGIVQYVDYETFKPSELNVLVWAVLKRLSFEHEHEFRLLIVDPIGSPDGIYAPISVDSLINDIYVSPITPDWMVKLVEDVMKRYGLAKPIVRSSLNSAPRYYEPPA